MVVHTIEFHGRLCRADGRPANPGTYDLLFSLYDGREAERTLWDEAVTEIPVAAGGFYHVVLGLRVALRAELFKEVPRYLGVRVIRGGRPAEEIGDRVPVLATDLRLAASHAAVEARLAALEAGGAGKRDAALTGKMRRRVVLLHRRLRRLEGGGGPLAGLSARIAGLEERLARLDGEEGRVVHIEDELEDIVGPDGDVVDLNERMDRLEAREPLRVVATPELHAVEARVDELQRRIVELEACIVARAPDPTVTVPPPESRTPRTRRAT